jgi:hypothetical protein
VGAERQRERVRTIYQNNSNPLFYLRCHSELTGVDGLAIAGEEELVPDAETFGRLARSAQFDEFAKEADAAVAEANIHAAGVHAPGGLLAAIVADQARHS